MTECEYKYIDVHIHLQDEQIFGSLDCVVENARKAGVGFMLCNSGGGHDWFDVLKISEQYKCVIPFLGLHPWFINKQDDNWRRELVRLVEKYDCGIGEAGLDKLLAKTDFDLQKQVFIEQLAIAKDFDRPITIHCLSSYGHLLKIIKDFAPLPQGSFIHSYNGSPEMIAEFIKAGLMFSYNGKVMEDKNIRYIKSIKATPAEYILLETDSPFMCPQGIKPPNVPANLPTFAEKITQIKDISADQLALIAKENALKIINSIKS